MDSATLLKVNNLTVRYPGAISPLLRDVDLSLHKGEITCVIGESGCGKSTLLNAIMQIPGRVEIVGGNVTYHGKDISQLSKKEMREIRGCGLGVVFQEPGASLNPIRKIFVQFYDAMRAHGKVTKDEVRQKAAAILSSLEFSNPERILDSCPAQLSGGMNQRVAIALAMALNPDILLADEPTSALDVTVQAQIVNELIELRNKYNTCILMITHNMGVVAKMADMVAVMYGGRIIEYGPREQILHNPTHPYTCALLEAIPRLDGVAPKGIPGKKPETFPEIGCAFAPRCKYAKPECENKPSEIIHHSENHWSMCKEGTAHEHTDS